MSVLERLDKIHLWHPFTQMKEWEEEEPLIIERGEGSYLIDIHGRRYLDGNSSLWVNLHGHRNKALDRALEEQLGKIAHSTLLGLGNVPSIELARMLVEIAPEGLRRVFYSDNGSTAVEIALKMSFQYWRQTEKRCRRKLFISFSGAYHGDTVGAMSVGDIDIFVGRYSPLLFRTLKAPYPYCYRCPLEMSYPYCGLACLHVLEDILRKEHSRVVACIIEPSVQGACGMIVSPPGFLKGVREITEKYGIPLIADEVATGFGRTGYMFACEEEGVVPDIMCLAKGITGGYLPLAVTLAKEEIYRAFLGRYDEFKALFHGHTYTGNPLACRVAIENLRIFKREKVLERLKPKIRLLSELLEGFRGLRYVGDVRYKGLMAGIELVEDRDTKKPFPPSKRVAYRVCMDARKKGLITRPLGDTIVIMPPLSIKKRELKRMIGILYELISGL